MKFRREYNMKNIGNNLRRCRENKHLTVEDVKCYLRIGSVQAIYKWEEGKNYPQADTLLALMELYEIGVADLLYEEPFWKNPLDIIRNALYVEVECREEDASFCKRMRSYLDKFSDYCYI